MAKLTSIQPDTTDQVSTELPIVNQFIYELGGVTPTRIISIHLILIQILGMLFEISYLSSRHGYLPDAEHTSDTLQRHMQVLEGRLRNLISRTTSPSSLAAFYEYIMENMYCPTSCMKICQKFIDATVAANLSTARQSSSVRIERAKKQREYMKRRREEKKLTAKQRAAA